VGLASGIRDKEQKEQKRIGTAIAGKVSGGDPGEVA
jgi:hypothetical protein